MSDLDSKKCLEDATLNNDLLFGVSLVAVIAASFLMINRCNMILWLMSIFLLIVFVPLLLFSAYVEYRKP